MRGTILKTPIYDCVDQEIAGAEIVNTAPI